MDKTIKTLTEVLQESKKEGTSPYDTTAEVVRIEGKTAWVHIPGGIDETPVSMTIDARVGDIVQVRVSGGRAWITGNASAPPTDDTVAVAARSLAVTADENAQEAQTLSEAAKRQAAAAARVAADTEQHFWFTSTGVDTGAHITEKTKEDFLADPTNGGGNLLARSNGVAIRKGLTELATFYVDNLGRTLIDLLEDNHGRITAAYYGSNLDDTEIVLRAMNDNGDSVHLDLSAWENSPAAGLIAGTKSIVLNNNGISLNGGDVVASGDITDGTNNVLSNKVNNQLTTPTATITASTGTLVSTEIRQFGKVVFMRVAVRNSSAVASGSNIFVGSLSQTALRPIINCSGAGYYGSTPTLGSITTTGSITIRNCSPASVTISGANSTAVTFTYFVS